MPVGEEVHPGVAFDRSTEEELWKGVGEFNHSVLQIPETDVSQYDIESIKPLVNPRIPAGNLNNEALVTFYCPRKGDTLMSGHPNLVTYTDSAGRPTSGVHLEIPKEVEAMFRLLSRFGTRLRARHGEGTIKFEASLFINIKLPGDKEWSLDLPGHGKV